MHCRQGKREGKGLGKGCSGHGFHGKSPVTGEALIVAVTNRDTHRRVWSCAVEEELSQIKGVVMKEGSCTESWPALTLKEDAQILAG